MKHINGRSILDTSLLLMSALVFIYAYNTKQCDQYGKLVEAEAPQETPNGEIFSQIEPVKPRKPFTSTAIDPNDPLSVLKANFLGLN